MPDTTYANLKSAVREAGLLEKRPLRYYGPRTAALAGMFAASISIMALADGLWIHLLNAGLMAFAIVQTTFLGHDLGHRQVFRRGRHNEAAGLIVSSIVGISRTWWVEKHNRHHSDPNDEELDPDLNLPVIAFSDAAAASRPRWARAIIRRQAALFYPLTCLEAVNLRATGMTRLIRADLRYPKAERAAMAAHLAGYLGAAFLLMEPLEATLFIVVNQALTGLYLSATFAPNHKGMPLIGRGQRPDFLTRQVTTSRNVRPGRLKDYLYGGLNYQIEHHLFPAMPRNCLGRARGLVMSCCQQRGLRYHETGVIGAQREILGHLNAVGRSMASRVAPA